MNSTHKPNNYITLDKGSKDGVKKDMGVISATGIVGIIKNVNEDYSAVNSLLHRRTSISAKIKRTGAFGGVTWVGSNPRYVNLQAIPNHQTVKIGDTIVTSGYSAHFPPELMIGVVDTTYLPSGSSFHHIEVLLSNDFSKLSYVEIIKNLKQTEQKALEKEVNDE